MKKILCMMLSLVLLIGLCACGSTPDDATSTEVEVIVEQDEVVYEETESKTESTTDNVSSSTPTTSEPTVSDVSSNDNTSSKQEENSSVSTPVVEESIYYLNNEKSFEKVKLNGRCDKTDYGVALNMSASAIEFNTNSSSVLLEINADLGLYYTVVVDGKVTMDHKPIEVSGTDYLAIARGLSDGTHNIKFIRDCEARGSLEFIVVNIQLDEGSKLLNKDADKQVIEFLGDSLTSGYGNLITGSANASDLKNQSATKAYSYLLANKLGMDYRIVSMSGIALGKREGYPTFPEFYALESYHLDKEKKYTSSNPADVDVVVVNLGTNDASDKLYNEKDPQSVKNYGKRYADLITNNGYKKDVKIVFVSGVCWCHTQTAAYNEAIAELKARGYNNTYTIDIRTMQSGGGGHPSAEEHKEVADTLYKFFKDNKIA
ncbi:MAG: hypothetical protein IKT42_02590 [Clostridia bacterium]|nr:hypothetical protein [Clostridia bacterium]